MLELKIDLYENNRDGMFEDICEEFGEDEVRETLSSQVITHITQIHDNKETLKEMQEDDNGNI